MSNILLTDRFKHFFLVKNASAFLIPGIRDSCTAGPRAVTMPKRTDAGLPPVCPRSTAVQLPVPSFFTEGGSVGPSARIADADDEPGEEAEETECNKEELEKVEGASRRVVASR